MYEINDAASTSGSDGLRDVGRAASQWLDNTDDATPLSAFRSKLAELRALVADE